MTARAWILAARPQTLPASLAPVAVGTALAHAAGGARGGPAFAAMAGALLLQIASNLANDVFDHEKGADGPDRLGPPRAVACGLLRPRAVRCALFLVLGAAMAVGAYLTLVAGWKVVALGLLAMACAVAYTGGPVPLGYHGLGDLLVLLFFGFAAVCGTAFVQLGRVARGARLEYTFLVALAFAVPAAAAAAQRAPLVALPLLTAPWAAALVRDVWRLDGRALNPILPATARLLLVTSFLLAAGIAL